MKMVAGLLDPTSGDVRFDGQSVTDIPAEKRRVAMVFQKPLLFPHMSIGDNVAFGLRMRGVDRKTRKKRVTEMMELVRLPGMEDRRPGQLSGGQEQRISLARGLITEPDILLLDEPLSQLDANLRIEMRDLIRHIQAELGITSIFVTHDQEEAVMLADRIALMLQGRIQQDGLPQDFYERPATQAVARFFGTKNFVPGTVRDHRFDSVLGTLQLSHDHPAGEGLLVIRQEAIEVGEGENSFEATIDRAMYLGTHVRVWAHAADVPLQFTVPPGVRYEGGQSITLRLPKDQTWVVPREERIL
jgi:ABC-type Fe3+/spermidine/putrescine transport system ATPase subunit